MLPVMDDLVLARHQDSTTFRPVLVAPNLPPFTLFCERHNGGRVVLPHHTPEVVRGVGKRTLRRNKGTLLVVALRWKQ